MTVPVMGENAPPGPMENPEIVDDPAFETYAHLPSGATAFQKFACAGRGSSCHNSQNRNHDFAVALYQ
jgi:hypothetical protein